MIEDSKPMSKVSVLMCVYNGELHVSQAIESILSQTFTDFEFIIVDDGSTDSTSEILANYAVKDSRIRVVCNKKNVGLERSLNIGLSFVKSQYLARQDADDVSFPNRLTLQAEFLDSHPEVGATGTAVVYIDEHGAKTGESCLPEDHASLQALLLFNNFMHHSTLMVRQNLMESLGGYDETKRYAEDYDLWWKLSKLSRLSSLQTPLLYRRMDDGPRITNKNRKQQLQCAFEISLQAVKDSLGKNSSALNVEAYRRWWWAYLKTIDAPAYQKFWVEAESGQFFLSVSDLKVLQPFWNFLTTHPASSEVWGERLRTLANDLLNQGQTLEGLFLMQIIASQFHVSIRWRSLVKRTISSLFQLPTQN